MAFLSDIPQLPEDPILGLPIAFAKDPRPNKINLGIGAYQTAEGQPLVLKSVREAEKLIFQQNLNKEYLPIEGDRNFIACLQQLLFDNQLQAGRVFSAQTVGGASALRIAAEFAAKLVTKSIFISQPTWSNHKQIFERAGLVVGSYPYFDPTTHLLDFEGMCQAILKMPQGALILLHGCCHNPTGIDPTMEQWIKLSELIKKGHIIPLFDIAYHGFGLSFEQDLQPIRYFIEEGHELFITYSCSKNFGLYGERVGLLSVVFSKSECLPKIASQVKRLIRSNYSNPPLHGARIVKTILQSEELTREWKKELLEMSERIKASRKELVEALEKKNKKGNYQYLLQQNGLFSFSGLTVDQVNALRQEKAIYMPSNGRINIAGINQHNLAYIADALSLVIGA